ncbi:hypothetical protein VYU27_009606, partial [Nannochloropsis oceanica]
MAGPQTKALIKAAQEALEKGEYGQAYALVPDPGLGGNVPYPLLVCKGLAAQMMGGKAEEAESLLLRATILQPDLPKAWKALVDLYEEGEKWKEAIGATERLLAIAQSKGNIPRACLLAYHRCCLEEKAREKSSSELREMWRAFVEKEGKEAPPSLLGPATLNLLAREEKRLELQPERRVELLPLYESLLTMLEKGDVVPSDSEDPFEDEGAGKEEGGGEGWREEGLVTHLPRLMAITMAASSPLDWGRVKETSRRILRVSPSCAPAADARILAWWYFPGEEGKEGRKGEGKEEGKEEEQEEEEVLLLARDSLRLRPSSPLPLLHLAWRLMCNGHVIPQALQLLTHATESG